MSARPLANERLTAQAPERPNVEAVLVRHRRLVSRFIRKRGVTADDVEDLTQETLVRAYQHFDGFWGGSPSTWLCTIARNVVADHHRRQRRTVVPLDSVPEYMLVELAPGAGEAELLASIIEDLPVPLRRLLYLRYVEGRSHLEVAALLKCSPGAARTRTYRALGALRALARRD